MYEVRIARDVERLLASHRLPDHIQQRVGTIMRDLRDDPYAHNAEALTARGNEYRIRVGEYRVIYTVSHVDRTIIVTRIAPRGQQTYRR